MKNSLIVGSLIIAFALIFFAATSSKGPASNSQNSGNGGNVEAVRMENGKQIIEVTARGGYYPRDIVAKANVPTILRMKTSGTFDCSLSFVIPTLNIQKMLPQTGVTDFELGSQTPGSSILGTCGMGMYRLSLRFE